MSPTATANVKLGYALSGEEHRPRDLIRSAAAAEDAGFEFAMISDHFHPWIDRQGQSVFVWSVLGGIAAATSRLTVGTGVTCPTMRIHPAILAQAAATTADLLDGRFWFGVGTGENLNEHILGQRWPTHEERLSMLEEAIDLIRRLWEGEIVSHRGEHYQVANARIYTLPETPPPILIAASGPETAALAGRIGDGLIATGPKPELIRAFQRGSRRSRPLVAQVTICWAKSEAEARRTAHQWWPTAAMPGQSGQELPMPVHFEELATAVTEDMVAEKITCGPDPEPHVEAIRKYVKAGFDHVYIHQVGPDQEGFLRFARRSLLPELERAIAA